MTNKPDIKCFLFKNPTLTKNINPIEENIFNSDDDNTNISTLKIYNNSTVINSGTKRKVWYLAGSSGVGHSSAGEANAYSFWEYILNPNSNYLLKIERIVQDGDTTGVFKLRFYEEDETPI